MAGYVQLGDVNTWYDEHGDGEPLVLLHPGMADARAFGPNLGALAERFHVYTPERRGHGRTPDVEGPITYELMAQDTIAFVETVVGGPAHHVGCSDGATVALVAAVLRPDLVRSAVLVSGVFHHEGWLPGVLDLDQEATAFLAAAHAEITPDGPGHFAVVAEKLDPTHRTAPTLGPADLARVTSRALVMYGDDDEIALEHTLALYRGLPASELAIVPGTSHGLLVEKPALCNAMLLEFLAGQAARTIAPIRRAG
jgi:pimeloyl-ACP methyl ester carboxylesterase